LFLDKPNVLTKRKSNSQNGNRSKINPQKVTCFSSRKSDRQLTSIHQQSTTNSPSKNHVLHTVFAKTPSKNGVNQRQKKIPQKSSYFSGGLVTAERLAVPIGWVRSWRLTGETDPRHGSSGSREETALQAEPTLEASGQSQISAPQVG
jgi:hypothetical protein